MTVVGVLGILLGLLAFAWASKRKDNARLALFLIIFVIHVASSYVYYNYAQTNDADTKLYYYDLYGFRYRDFELGTVFVVFLTQKLRDVIGGSYLDYFLLYQALGLWGLGLLMRTLEELGIELNSRLPIPVIAVLFLPGMYFWTSAIGKDAPLFLACALAVWSSFHISRRWVWFGIAIAIMILFRAHVALVTMASLALALVAGKGVPTIARIALAGTALISVFILFDTLQSSLNVDLSSADSITSLIELQTTAATTGVDDTLAKAFFGTKLFSLLYQPLFIDADGIFGLIASFQNLVMLYITFELIRNFGLLMKLFRDSLPLRFATIHFVALYLMLALMYYNVGLGLRQREMASPALIIVFAAVFILSRTGSRARLTTAELDSQYRGPAPLAQ